MPTTELLCINNKIFMGGFKPYGQRCITQHNITFHYTRTLNDIAMKASNPINHLFFKIRQRGGIIFVQSAKSHHAVCSCWREQCKFTGNTESVGYVCPYDQLKLNIETYLSWRKTEIIFTWARGSSGALEPWSWGPLMTLGSMGVSIGTTFLNCRWRDFREVQQRWRSIRPHCRSISLTASFCRGTSVSAWWRWRPWVTTTKWTSTKQNKRNTYQSWQSNMNEQDWRQYKSSATWCGEIRRWKLAAAVLWGKDGNSRFFQKVCICLQCDMTPHPTCPFFCRYTYEFGCLVVHIWPVNKCRGQQCAC